MGKKPRSATQMAIMRNAKKKKVSKNLYVRYPDAAYVEAFYGIRMTDKDKSK